MKKSSKEAKQLLNTLTRNSLYINITEHPVLKSKGEKMLENKTAYFILNVLFESFNIERCLLRSQGLCTDYPNNHKTAARNISAARMDSEELQLESSE